MNFMKNLTHSFIARVEQEYQAKLDKIEAIKQKAARDRLRTKLNGEIVLCVSNTFKLYGFGVCQILSIETIDSDTFSDRRPGIVAYDFITETIVGLDFDDTFRIWNNKWHIPILSTMGLREFEELVTGRTDISDSSPLDSIDIIKQLTWSGFFIIQTQHSENKQEIMTLVDNGKYLDHIHFIKEKLVA
jgi:hypothetical protein